VPFESAAIPGVIAEDSETDEDEADEQPGMVRADQAPGGERRPRRRGRRGGRRRRGGLEDGLAGSIADELGPTSAPEASSAVADFDGNPSESSRPAAQPEFVAASPEQHQADSGQQEATRGAEAEAAQDAERAARRRSTVREKVSFLVEAQPAAAPAAHSQPEPAPAPRPDSETSTETQPRRAGWWSRRFGGGE
jgi:ribonuclease E